MNERFIYLIGKKLDDEITKAEQQELDRLIANDESLKSEYEKQLKAKEVLKKMNLKNPSKEFWDGYWLNTYNKLERGLAWIFISIGILILIGFAVIQFVEKLFTDDGGPILIKIGLAALFFGSLVLIFSLLREKFFKMKNDKYKEIQR